MRVPWREIIATGAGIAITVVPGLTGARDSGADTLHVLGPVIASVGVMTMSGALTVLRWVNVVLGAAVVAAAFVFALPAAAAILAIGAGVVAAVASTSGGPDPHFRGRWRALSKREGR